MSVLSAEEALSRSRILLRQHSPFFAVLTLFANYRFDPSIEVVETDGRNVLLNEDIFIGLDDKQRIGLLLHVTLHAALQHTSRMHGRDPLLWNIACDVMVNYIIHTETPFPPPVGTLQAKDLDTNLIPKTAELVYEWLQKNSRSAQQLLTKITQSIGSGAGRALSLGNQLSAQRNGVVDEKAEAMSSRLQKGLRESSLSSAFAKRFSSALPQQGVAPVPSQPTDAESVTRGIHITKPIIDLKPAPDDATRQAMQQHWNAALLRAQQHNEMRQRGVDPGKWSRELNAACDPPLPWQTLLSRFIIKTPTDFSGLDRRFIYSGLYLETLEQETVNIVVAVDTSGSITSDELNNIAKELESILGVYPHIECALYYCDTVLHGPYALGRQHPLPDAVGGGGTDFRPFFKMLEEQRRFQSAKSFSAAIYFTDGFGAFPAISPDYPVLWVVLPGAEDDEAFPFGEVVRMGAI